MADTADREQAAQAVAQVTTREEEAKIGEVEQAVSAIVGQAQSMEVRTAEEAVAATEFLSVLAREKRTAENARKFLVKPLNDHVKAINARFAATTDPLVEADTVVRRKVAAYDAEQDRVRAEEEQRLEAERQARQAELDEQRAREEAAARAEREEAARAAVAAEAEARRVAAERERELRAQNEALTAEIAAMSDSELRAVAHAPATDDAGRRRAQAAARERQLRRERAEAAQRAEEARAAEQAAREAEAEAAARPAVEAPRLEVAAPVALKSTSGSISRRKVWTATVVDPARVPDRFKVVDQKAINAAMRGGERDIPGVRIEQVSELAVRAAS
jgi:hypothetical protein